MMVGDVVLCHCLLSLSHIYRPTSLCLKSANKDVRYVLVTAPFFSGFFSYVTQTAVRVSAFFPLLQFHPVPTHRPLFCVCVGGGGGGGEMGRWKDHRDVSVGKTLHVSIGGVKYNTARIH